MRDLLEHQGPQQGNLRFHCIHESDVGRWASEEGGACWSGAGKQHMKHVHSALNVKWSRSCQEGVGKLFGQDYLHDYNEWLWKKRP